MIAGSNPSLTDWMSGCLLRSCCKPFSNVFFWLVFRSAVQPAFPDYSVKTSCRVVSVAVKVLPVTAPTFLTNRALSTVRI